MAEKHCGLTQSLLFLINKVHMYYTHTSVIQLQGKLEHSASSCDIVLQNETCNFEARLVPNCFLCYKVNVHQSGLCSGFYT